MGQGWAKLKGTLIHRCVLAQAGKWLYIEQATATGDFNGVPMPSLEVETRWHARHLARALAEQDDNWVYALIDSGGPYWSAHYADYKELSEGDKNRALENLEDLSAAAAQALLEKAQDDGWQWIRSEVEVGGIYGFLRAENKEDRDRARRRLDLLVKRDGKIPLFVDLKTSEEPVSDDKVKTKEEKVRKKYEKPIRKVLGRPVDVVVLNLDFDQNPVWSDRDPKAPKQG